MKKAFWRDFWAGFAVAFTLTILAGRLRGVLSIDNKISLIGVIISATAIFFISWNTSRQIRNQNKESHRPYLAITMVTDKTNDNVDAYSPYYEMKTYNILQNPDLPTMDSKVLLNLANVGYGTAINIKIYSLDDKIKALSNKFKQTTKIALATGLDLESKKNIDKLFEIKYYCNNIKQIDNEDGKIISVYDEEYRDYCNFVLFYRDLNKHVYSTVFSLSFNCHGAFQYGYHSEETANYKNLLTKLPIDYEEIKQKYLKDIIDNNE